MQDTSTNTDKSDDWSYFDDCPVCQAMKKADREHRNLTYTELTEAFDEANKK